MEILIFSMAVSLVLALIAGKVMIPLLRRLKLGQQIRHDGPQAHLSKAGTPSMGGIIFLMPLAITMFIFGGGQYAVFMLATTLGFAVIGFLDDFIKVYRKRSLGLRAYQKIIGQLGMALIIAFYAYNDPNIGSKLWFFGNIIDLGIWFIPFTVFVVVAMVNAVNLTDGLDGLAGGVSVINAAALGLICFVLMTFAYTSKLTITGGMYENAMIFAFALVGGLFGFLFYNSYPAYVFMGDTGSLALGAAITVLGVVTGMQFLLPIMGIMFVASAVSVIMQVGYFKLTKGKRIFKMAPLHHHFELSGFSEKKIVIMYMLITIATCVLAVFMLNIV